MRTPGRKPLYRHHAVALMRAAAVPLTDAPERWPDPADTEGCREWLQMVWGRPGFADAVRLASPTLAGRVDAVCAGRPAAARQVRRAAAATVRYLLRATGRHTPFGLFAGVAPASVGPSASVRWGADHRSVARVDTQWLAEVVERLEACPELLERLEVVFNNLAVRRGGRLEAPLGVGRVTVRYTSAIQAVRDACTSPIRFGVLADKLAETFPGADAAQARGMLTELVQHGFLITCLRAPFTISDPLGHLLCRLHEVGADSPASHGSVFHTLDAIQREVHHHNHQAAGAEQASSRTAITNRMRALSAAGRTPLAVDLWLDGDVQVPEHVAREMEWAASALARLTRQPTGEATWRDYFTAFSDRYGTGTLVPLTDVVDPDAGLGLPAGYPGSVQPPPAGGLSGRDERLLALAWKAMADGAGEITLTEETIEALAVGDPHAEPRFPPHVELAARIHATNAQALDRGDYILTVAPARSVGTMTSRFTTVAVGSGLEHVYRTVPTAVDGALRAQLSFPPAYPHAENVCRVPAYLPHVLSLGEHRGGGTTTIPLDDLAVTATRDGLHLVSLSRRRVVEPQVFHALALDKQPPPLARFLAHLPRALGAAWTEFDWGPHAHLLPYLPRVRYRRAVLSPARWRLTTGDVPADDDAGPEWRQALQEWRRRWSCPETVELHDADRSLPLTVNQPAHAAVLWAHLQRHGYAILTEAADPAEFGWIDGHAHEIVLPLVSTRPAAPAPRIGSIPQLTNRAHGHVPGSAGAAWLNAKIHTHPERFDELIAEHLPLLLTALDEPRWWFVRYRSPHETDHLRLRIRTRGQEHHTVCIAAVGAWAQRLRQDGVAGRLVLDTYFPEVGRYEDGAAIDAAERVFVADSHAVYVQLQRLPAGIAPAVVAAVNMVDMVRGFLGSLAAAMAWLASCPAPTAAAADRSAADHVISLVRAGALRSPPGWPPEVTEAWQARTTALAAYRAQLPADADTDAVLESLLHMHHNRALGIDRDGEKACRRLARQAALAWTTRQEGSHL